MRLFLFLLIVIAAADLRADSKAQTLKGKVVGVHDGDTITVLVDKVQHRIRLVGVDAPETSQPFGSKAKQVLSEKLFNKTVTVKYEQKDDYQRILGKVYLSGKLINNQMVAEGFAWQYKQYNREKELAEAEAEARKAKLGLWADKNPTPPWDFRHANKPLPNAAPANKAAPAAKTLPAKKLQPANAR